MSVPSSSSSSSRSAAATAPAKEVAPFLRSLRLMLTTEHASILRWSPDGCAFEIHDLPRMTSHVLPKYFKHAKYSSFQRQLNYFSFRKWTRSKTAVCTFSNPFFQRDAPDLVWRITRKKSVPLAPRLSIVVPKPGLADFDGLRSPTDAASMVQQHQLFSPPPPPLAPLDAYAYGPSPQPAAPSWEQLLPPPSHAAADDRGTSLDWVDSLYSSLDAATQPGDLQTWWSDAAACESTTAANVVPYYYY